MAESIKGYGKILGDTSFEFSLDGLASHSQMKKLLQVTEAMAKKMGASVTGSTKAEKEEVDLLKEKNKQTEKSIDLEEEKQKRSDELDKKFRNLSKTTEFFKGNLATAGSGYTTGLTLLTTGVGTLLGALTGYADNLQQGLQRGISGGIMDFAIAAKTGGVKLEVFSKALEESGGGFASLGAGATEGAKNFGALIGSVRSATAGVGNLGLSNDQLAMFTAQQVKVATAQGFKGKAAQDVVISNTRALGKELDTLANQTGKSVLEMTQAAVKLAQDPLVSSFVRDVKTGGAEVAKSLNSYAANFSALFGKEGDKLARDTLGPALAGLPMIINDTGKNMALASQSTFNEINRLAQKAKAGEQMTDEDRQRLSDTIKQEMATRGGEIRMMAELGGPLGDSAKQFLSLAQEVEFYNSAAGEQRRKEDKAAQEFNTAMNQFKANLQALAIPLLKFANGIPWDTFIKTLNVFVDTLGFVLKPFTHLGEILGATGAGSFLAAVAGIVGALAVAKTGYDLLNKAVSGLSNTTISLDGLFKKLQTTLSTPGGALGGGLGGVPATGGPGGKTGPARGGLQGLADKEREIAAKAAEDKIARIERAAELKKANAGMTSAQALERAALEQASANQGPKAMPTPKTGAEAFGYAAGQKASGALRGAKDFIKSPTGLGVASWLGGAALDTGASALKESGHETAGKVTSTLSGALSGASTGAMIGSIIPGLGTAAGALIGGAIGALSTAVTEWKDSDSADGLTDADAAAVSESTKFQSQSLDEQRAMVREMRQMREDMGYGNAIAARQVSVTETGNRQLANLQYGAQ